MAKHLLASFPMMRPPFVKNDLTYYDTSAEQWWDESNKIFTLNYLNPPRFGYFDRHISNWEGLTVLDVGCGGGFSCEFMAKRGAHVYGLDQSSACIEAARRHGIEGGLTLDYRTGVGEQLPYDADKFDVVICVDVLEHVADVPQVIREIHRVLKPGGSFCFDTINRNFKSRVIMIWLMENLLREIPQGIHDWDKFIRPEELRSNLENTGFNQIEIKGFDMFSTGPLAYLKFRATKQPMVKINDDTSVMYIGRAVKA